MSKSPRAPQNSDVFGLLLVFCLTAFLGGLGFDIAGGARLRFWIGDQPAAAGAVGIAAVLFVVLVAHVGRILLDRRHKEEEGGDGRTQRTHP
ncbi:MAG: hypothetical protein R3C31_14310 [Hyphomonadaceae bacterium]